METWVMSLVAVMAAILSSVVTVIVIWLKWGHGILKIDHFNADKDIYRFEIDSIDNLSNKKFIILSIDHHADLSQK